MSGGCAPSRGPAARPPGARRVAAWVHGAEAKAHGVAAKARRVRRLERRPNVERKVLAAYDEVEGGCDAREGGGDREAGRETEDVAPCHPLRLVEAVLRLVVAESKQVVSVEAGDGEAEDERRLRVEAAQLVVVLLEVALVDHVGLVLVLRSDLGLHGAEHASKTRRDGKSNRLTQSEVSRPVLRARVSGSNEALRSKVIEKKCVSSPRSVLLLVHAVLT